MTRAPIVSCCVFVLSLCGAACPVVAQTQLPVVKVTSDNTEITKSCRVVIEPGAVLEDADGNGVIHIKKDGVRVVFEPGSALWGGARPEESAEGAWDQYTGIGIRVMGAKGVVIRGARVHGFKVGIWATDCDELRIEGADLSDNYRQRLESTPLAENSEDWLFPHRNDNDEWATQHGAGLYVRDSKWPTIRDVRVRRGQNGILLHSVREGLVYDNDCSFLSGWGLGMFRTTGTTVSRNAFDFCIRGHSEGVYNRGQDSAGILMFEQCSNNLILENSCTHSGDGIFGFAGLEAVNGEGAAEGYDFKRRGCNDNVFAGNDLSYAAAHGLEMTFSFGNTIVNNRFIENAICGVWGGYSQDTVIARNEFRGNGGMAYGLERGGVNIEHGAGNVITGNEFLNNRCAVHLWWDAHGDFETKAWGMANYKGVRDNVVAGNIITIDPRQPFGRVHPDRPLVGMHVRDEEPGGHVQGLVFARNAVTIDPAVGIERLVPTGVEVSAEWDGEAPAAKTYAASGDKRPVGARSELRGRHRIIMGPWGPWDHEGPMLRFRGEEGGAHVYEVFGTGGDLEVSSGLKTTDANFLSATADVQRATDRDTPAVIRITPSADRNGVFPYSFVAHVGLKEIPVRGAVVSTAWQITSFEWDEASDPRTNLAGWRELATRDEAFSVMAETIDFAYGNGGPRSQKWAGPLKAFAPGPDYFGMIVRTRLTLAPGRWRFTTLSDDGVRVMVEGKPVIENWTWHGPTTDTGVFELAEEREVEVVVEHFEIDGHAVLKLDISPER